MAETISIEMNRVARLIPGYDPFTTAGVCWFDAESAQTACDFFPECLQHVKGELAGKPLILEPWQCGIIANLFGWKRADGSRRYREAFIFLPRKSGKALAVNTPIPTPTGWAAIGDISVGDTVFDDTGKRCRVLAVSDIMYNRPCYRVTFSD